MKIRNGFVSNSSSSSFLVVGAPPQGGTFVKLTKEQAKKVAAFITNENFNRVKISTAKPLYLTKFYSDGSQRDVITNWSSLETYEYVPGGHGGPYFEEDFIELEDEVWIRKDHNVRKKAKK